MEEPFDEQDLVAAERCLGQGDLEAAASQLERVLEAAEGVIAAECVTTDDVQYFSFDSPVDRLAYRRVEDDPRQLVQVGFPYDRLYADVAFCYIRREDWADARTALSQAVRWNPMNCAYRLNLAEVCRAMGDTGEWAALSFSVLERARDCRHLARAYANLGMFFVAQGEGAIARGCSILAQRFDEKNDAALRLRSQVSALGEDVASISEEDALAAMEAQGLPVGANAEMAICLLMCAADAGRIGDRAEATRLALSARDLVGEDAAKALMQLINDTDAELAAEKHAEDGEADA